MLGNQPAWFGGRLRGKGPTNGHLAAQPTQYGSRQLTFVRFLEICWALGVDPASVVRLALQRSRLQLRKMAIRVDLRALSTDQSDTYRPILPWARNTLNEHPDGVVELDPIVVKHLANSVGCDYLGLVNHLARFIPDDY